MRLSDYRWLIPLSIIELLLTRPVYAWQLLTLNRGYVEVQKYLPGSYDPLLAQQSSPFQTDPLTPNMALNLGLDFSLPLGLYWNNVVESQTDQTQFRSIAYWFEVGEKIGALQVFVQHRSQHALDSTWSDPYPRYFSVGVRYQFLTKEHR